MLISRGILVLSTLSLLAAAMVLPAQQTPPASTGPKAEVAFKNIKSFKGQDASVVLPAMHMMGASLGVGCNFCHEEGKFDSDAKPEKDSAREMIAMTKEINEKNFGGRPAITCMTCHRGSPHPQNLAAALPLRPNMRADKTLVADDIMAGFRTASGVPATISGVTIIRLKGSVIRDGMTSTEETYQSSDGKFRDNTIDPKSGAHVFELGYDGTTSWANQGGHVQAVGAPSNVALLRYEAFFWNGASGFTDLTAGKEKMDGKDTLVVHGTQKDSGATVKLYFDPTTHLLVRAAYFDRTVLGSMGEIYDYSDYKMVGTMMVPMTISQWESPTSKVVRHYDSGEVAGSVPADTFGLPRG